MKFTVTIRGKNTTADEMIADIQRVSEKLGKNTVTQCEYNDNGKYNASTLKRKIGSWFKILDLAGLKPSRSPIDISEQSLMENLTAIWLELGRQPSYSEVKSPLSKYSAGTYENRYGSWTNALIKFNKYTESDDTVNGLEISDVNRESVSAGVNVSHKTKRHISDRMRFRILMRDGFTCKSCGASPVKDLNVELHVDHIKPWSLGGETITDN